MNNLQEKEIRNLGIIVIVLGIIHFFATGVLSSTWGVVLVIFGVICILSRKLICFLILGIFLAVIGLVNIVNSLIIIFIIGEGLLNYLWLIFGGFQIYWGITTIIKYTKLNKTKEK